MTLNHKERAWATIDLNALKANVARVHELNPAVKLTAVIKANGYGHGMSQLARTLTAEELDIDCFALATIDEVVDDIIKELTQDTRLLLASLNEDQIEICEIVMGILIRSRFTDIDEAVKAILMADCFAKSDYESLDETDVASDIFQGILDKLKETHRLKVVK